MPYNSLTVTPAYGRDYKSKAEVLKDWNDNKDFVAPQLTRTYVNKKDLKTYPHGFTHVHIRYKKSTLVCVVELQ